MAKAKAFQTDIRRERKKKKIKRALRRLAVVVAVVAAGAGIYFTRATWIPWFDNILERAQQITVNDGALKEGNFPIEISDYAGNAEISKFDDDEFVLAGDTYISFYTSDGERKSSIQHAYADPVVKVGDGRVLVYESAGETLSVMNEKETILETETDGEIYFAEIASNNSYAVVTTSEGFSSYLTVYDKNGDVIYRYANSRRITAVDFTSDGYGCFVSAFKMDGGVISSTVTELSFDSEEPKLESEEIKSTSVISACRLSDGSIAVICDDRVIRLDSNGKIKDEKEYKTELVDFDSSSEIVSIAVKSLSDETKSRLIIVCSDVDDYTELNIDDKIKSLSVDSKNTYLLGNRTMMLFSATGSQLATADISSAYVDFVYLDDEVLFLGYSEINKIDYAY